jgi:hypothetical protein
MYQTLLAITTAILLTCGTGNALAYTLIRCLGQNVKWASNRYAVSAASVSFPPGPWRNALASVVNSCHNNPSLLGYSISYNDPSVGLQNGQSEVWFSAPFGPPAVANQWWSNCRFTEVDVRFDNTVPYHYTTNKTSLWPYGGSSRPFQTTAIHEFGHAGGLLHTANVYSVMGSDFTHIHANGAQTFAYVGEDASAGLVALYGLWSTGRDDLGVAHWRRVGNSGEYSTHARTRIFSSAGIELPKVCAACAEPVYRVDRGQTVRFELNYENLGKKPKTVTVGYYVSTDNRITTADIFLGAASLKLVRDTVFTALATLTIPGNLTRGRSYWLGAIVDHRNAVRERYENNNATYTGIFVQ